MTETNPKSLDFKRQKKWKESGIYKVVEDKKKEKFYILDMFPYPSGAGLHVGHPKGYIASDSIARKKMLEGYNVLHPMGFDTFGLGTENYAIEHKMKPQDVAKENIETYIKQLELFGTTYDRSRSVNTADPKYFKRTQRIFLQMYNHYYDEKINKAMPITDPTKQERLAYVDYKPINRCPSCMTGLANEDLDDGKCERCGSVVEQKPMKQRVLRITKYAQRLIDGLDKLSREESMKDLERNWIGKSEGTQFKMNIENSDLFFEVYTTRIDTVFGMSFVTIAPEHPLVDKITTLDHKKAVEKYKEEAKHKTQLERTELQKDKTGVFCGAYAINPFNNSKVPIFVGDYVLANYGTGVVMAVPAHDERDFEFAKKYNLHIPQSIAPLFGNTAPEALFREDKKTVHRHITYSIIYNPKTDKYLILDLLTGEKGQSMVVGGIEENEDTIGGTLREIQEETGYKNLRHIKQITGEIHAKFYAIHKDENRYSIATTHLFELIDEQQDEIAEHEKSRHNILWLSKNEVAIKFHNQKYARGQYINGESAFTDYGILVNSGEFTLFTSEDVIAKMNERLKRNKIGGKKINYKMQDRVFSRQRYRGEPFPILRTEDGKIIPLDEKDLPLTLPDVENYAPTGTEEGPLATIDDRVNVTLKNGTQAKRETNTMPGRAGSSRYRLRYMNPTNDKKLVDPKKEKYRKNVDVYIGGAEHVTRHMIYARFWQKFLYDIGIVSQDEPFQEYHYVGLIMGEDGRKMSKRRGNVVNPDDIINEFGADTLRTYEMFMGPFDQAIARSTNGIKGVKKFLDKIIALKSKLVLLDKGGAEGNEAEDLNNSKTLILLHQTIKKVGEDIDTFRFNTAVSQLMILVNHLTELEKIDRKTFETLVILVSPFAPHTAEELREQLGNEYSIFTKAQRPKYEEKYLVSDEVTLAVQVNGKMKGTILINKDADQNKALELVKSDPKLSLYITGDPKKIIYVQGKILNIIL